MSDGTDSHGENPPSKEMHIACEKITLNEKNKKIFFEMLLLGSLRNIFLEIFQQKLFKNENHFTMESYEMDRQIVQFVIQEILNSDLYTLEGIACYSRLPFDVVYEAACGIGNSLSITLWARIVELYIQIKPEIINILISKLVEMHDKYHLVIPSMIDIDGNRDD